VTASQAPRTVALGGGRTAPYPHPVDAAATTRGKANRRRDTKIEVAIRSALHGRGLRFRKDYLLRCSNGVRVRADVAFTRPKVAAFVDGCFWHRCPQHGTAPGHNQSYWLPKLESNVERDRRVDAALAADGWHVLRIWEHEAVEDGTERVVALLRALGQTKRS
jgi:DNA mismatch endonuclease (patch repair protein)